MRVDYLGNPVTVSTDASLAAVNDFVDGFLAYETRAANVLSAADADPASALLNVYAGVLWLLLESPEGPGRAAPYVDKALAARSAAHPREQAAVDFLLAWFDDDIPRALAMADAILAAWPRAAWRPSPTSSATCWTRPRPPPIAP